MCIVLGVLFSMALYLVMVFSPLMMVLGCLFRGNFVVFYFGSPPYGFKFADPFLHC
jgi:hypothetical protein